MRTAEPAVRPFVHGSIDKLWRVMLRAACWGYTVTTCKRFATFLDIDLGTASTLFAVLYVIIGTGLGLAGQDIMKILSQRLPQGGVEDFDDLLEDRGVNSTGRKTRALTGEWGGPPG